MHWQDEAIILNVYRFNETSLRLEVFSTHHGRYGGVVCGGATKSRKSAFDIGNILHVRWRARLAEQLGSFTTELLAQPAAKALADPLALAMLYSATALLLQKLPERHAESKLYECFKALLLHLSDDHASYLPMYIAFEIHLLSACGFPLDLSRCAATGSTHSLAFVSPKSGRAVSKEAGAPYANRLLKLPAFLAGSKEMPAHQDLLEALKITSYFLEHHANEITHKPLPQARQRFLHMLEAENLILEVT